MLSFIFNYFCYYFNFKKAHKVSVIRRYYNKVGQVGNPEKAFESQSNPELRLLLVILPNLFFYDES